MAINEKDGAIETPNIDLAKAQVLAIEQTNTQIKSILVKSKKEFIPLKEINQQINDVIKTQAQKFNKYPDLKELFVRSMRANSQKWSRIYTENLKFINNKVLKQLNQMGISIPQVEFGFNNADTFRPFVADNKKGLALIKDYEKQVQKEIRKLVQDNPKTSYYDKNGKVRTKNLRNEAETRVRLQANREDIENIKDKERFVITSTHADCSPRCEQWQGRLFSTDGTSGFYDGLQFIPLEEAMEGENGDGNGIITGYNCRHRAIPYRKGMRKPEEYSKQEIKKERKLDQKQRYHENRIRHMKLEERLAKENGNIERAEILNERWKKENNKYEVFSLRNQRAFYRWRTKIGDEGVM